MTQKDRDMLIRIDERTNETHLILKGGEGQPGLCKRFDIVENNQIHCLTQHQEEKNQTNDKAARVRVDLKWAIIAILGLAELYLVFIK